MSYVPVTRNPTIIQRDLKGGLMEQLKHHSPQFAKIVQKAQLDFLMNENSDITVFAPCASYDITDGLIQAMSIGDCKDLVNRAIVNRVVKINDLTSSPYWKIPTRISHADLVLRTNSNMDLFVNRTVVVEGDICAVNGMLHLLNGMIH